MSGFFHLQTPNFTGSLTRVRPLTVKATGDITVAAKDVPNGIVIGTPGAAQKIKLPAASAVIAELAKNDQDHIGQSFQFSVCNLGNASNRKLTLEKATGDAKTSFVGKNDVTGGASGSFIGRLIAVNELEYYRVT